jgi:DNA invertase Pin-like site-specific DNA recombinase
VLGYVSSDASGADSLNEVFERQTEQIVSVCRQRQLSLVGLVRDHQPRRGHALQRPGLGYALQRLSDGGASGLVVDELFRLAPTFSELGGVLGRLVSAGVRLIAARPELDTQEKAGKLAVDALIAISRNEHRRLALRTRKGMIAAREKGPRRVADYPDLKQRIGRMRASGLTLQAIADQLNAEGVPTLRGGAKWRPSSVQVAAGYHRPSGGTWAGSLPEQRSDSRTSLSDCSRADAQPPVGRETDPEAHMSVRRVPS